MDERPVPQTAPRMAAAAAEEALFAQLNGAFDSDPLMDELGLVLSAAPTEFGDTSGDVGAGGESGAADGGRLLGTAATGTLLIRVPVQGRRFTTITTSSALRSMPSRFLCRTCPGCSTTCDEGFSVNRAHRHQCFDACTY